MLRRLWIRLLAAATPGCDEVTRLVSESQERPLTRWERSRLWAHYKICDWCRRYQQQLELLGRLTREAGTRPASDTRQLSPGAKEKLHRALDEQRAE